MGKSLQSAAKLYLSSAKAHSPKGTQPKSPNRVATPRNAKPPTVKVELQSLNVKKIMEAFEREQCRTPLANVVADCAKRWFHDTLKEAKAGDSSMQVLVAQMYFSGYGVPRDPQKGQAWISKASRSRNSVWKVCGKHPGYRASDSDSCEQENKDKCS